MSIESWSPIGGYNFIEDHVTLLPGYTIAPAFNRGTAQLLPGEPDALQAIGTAVKSNAAGVSLMRLVGEVQGGTPSEQRAKFQLIFRAGETTAYVEYAGAREEVTSHPEFIGKTLAELASRRIATE